MRRVNRGVFISVLGVALTIAAPTFATDAIPPAINGWEVVVNNGYDMPTNSCNPAEPTSLCRKFNSYNQPSVNVRGLVVIRARSRGGEVTGQQPVHGVYTRDMATPGSSIVKILDRSTPVPQPNNLDTLFTEPPSFPRIDMNSNTIATRGNHQPTWVDENGDRFGTTGIYANPFGQLITAASKLGIVPYFSFFEVPGASPGTPFDVFPGSPSITDKTTIVFKGNYTEEGSGKTGVYYRILTDAPIPVPTRSLEPAGGTNPVVLIANTDTLIPGTTQVFGSLAPPSAADGKAVFVGLDNEESPTVGGIYLVKLSDQKLKLKNVVKLGSSVPGEKSGAVFNKIGEGLSFDGRFVAFWGAWGAETKTLQLQCPTTGNKDRVAYCNEICAEGCTETVPVHQGIFVHDLDKDKTYAVAKTGDDFSDFLYWNFSGHVPGSAGEDDGEPARWRSSAFVAVSGLVDGSLTDAHFHVAFKARKGEAVEGVYKDPVDGIYLSEGPGNSPLLTLVETGMDGSVLDPTAKGLPATEVGIERDGFRGNSLVINAVMGSEETGWGGVYMTKVLE